MTPLTTQQVSAVMDRQDRPKMDAIVKDVADKTGISVEEMCGHSRKRPIARARQLAMWQLHRHGIKLSAIGSFLGGRDHTTIHWGIKKIETLMASCQDDDLNKV